MKCVSFLLLTLSLLFNKGSGLLGFGDDRKYILHNSFAGSELICTGACHQAQQALPHLTDLHQVEFAHMRKHLSITDDYSWYFASTTRQTEKNKDTTDDKTYPSSDHEYAAECVNTGMTSSISYVPILSSKDTGYIFASISSSVPGLRRRYFSLEGRGGRSGYTLFTGVPSEGPVTLFAILQPTRVGPLPLHKSTFLIEQALIFSSGRGRVPLKSKLIRYGKFNNSLCTFLDDEPFLPFSKGKLKETRSMRLNTANENFSVGFRTETNVTSVRVSIKNDECVAIVLSTGPGCCVVNKNVPVITDEKCHH